MEDKEIIKKQEEVIEQLRTYYDARETYKDSGAIKIVQPGFDEYLKELESELSALKSESEKPKSKAYDIDFNGNLKCRIIAFCNQIEVEAAMNGYGNGISVSDISISEVDCICGTGKNEHQPHDCTHGFVQRVEFQSQSEPKGEMAEEILEKCEQCGNATYKELHCRECGNNFPHSSYFSRINMAMNGELPREIQTPEDYFISRNGGKSAEAMLNDDEMITPTYALQLMIDYVDYLKREEYKSSPDLRRELLPHLESISNNARHEIPYYAYGGSEVACDFAGRLESIYGITNHLIEYLQSRNETRKE